MKINIHKILPDTTAEGPGHRFCIWVQGCSRHCPGCMAEATWNPDNGNRMETEEIIRMIKEQPDLEGITFLGGEPFEQAAALAEIAWYAQAQGLSVICFTGHTFEQLQERSGNDEGTAMLLSGIDLLIDGEYRQEQREFSRPWVGSANQRFLYLTNRYSAVDIENAGNRIEIRIRRDGSVMINGMADFHF